MVSLMTQFRSLSQKAIEKFRPIPATQLIWKANEDDPLKHTRDHLALLYQLPMNRLISIFGATSPFKKEVHKWYEAIGMMPIMIREPSLHTIDYINNLYYQASPNLRVLLYGDRGNGKTNIVSHIVHYLQAADEHLVIHVRDMKKFTIKPTDKEDSFTRAGRLDTPMDAAIMLQKFKIMNKNQLEKFNDILVASQDYTWSGREVTKKGEPLLSIIEHGVNRLNHASDCFAVLCKELMLAADSGKIKLATVLDQVEHLYRDIAYDLKHNDRSRVYVDQITVARALKKLISGSHKSSITIATCDDKMKDTQNQLPGEILGDHGWKAFEPCLPLNVPKYSRIEYESYMNFLQDIGWLTRPEACTIEGRDEIRFISGMNPREVSYICRSL